MTKLLIIGLGGFIGAVARYGLSGWVHRFAGGVFPYGTLVVNCTGCLLIGCFLYLVEDRAFFSAHPQLRLFLSIGILGAFSTFSTFGYETANLFWDRKFSFALLNIGGNVILGLGAVWLGRTLLRALNV